MSITLLKLFLTGFVMKKATVQSAQAVEGTKKKLIKAARLYFSERGYANTSMDEFTATVGLTRGALYHHFGSKQGLFAEVIKQIDGEIDEELLAISDRAENPWQGLFNRGQAYLEKSLDPEVQQILLKDAKSVLGSELSHIQMQCIESVAALLSKGMKEKFIQKTDPDALAVFINGSLTEAAFWIASDTEPHIRLSKAVDCWAILMKGIKA